MVALLPGRPSVFRGSLLPDGLISESKSLYLALIEARMALAEAYLELMSSMTGDSMLPAKRVPETVAVAAVTSLRWASSAMRPLILASVAVSELTVSVSMSATGETSLSVRTRPAEKMGTRSLA